MGFFKSSQLVSSAPTNSTVPKCGACGLYMGCNSPKMPVTGEGRKEILVIGEAPGETEDEQNEQFVGTTGQLLRDSLSSLDISLDRDCWKTNSLICRPPKNRNPRDKEIDYCRPNATNAIKELKPKIILLLGKYAIQSVIGLFWPKIGNVSSWVGWQIPSQRYNCWICPTYHPSFVSRDKNGSASVLFNQHLRNMEALIGSDRPWSSGTPDYKSRVEVIFEVDRASKFLGEMMRRGGTVAFDYETTSIKPESGRIVSNAVCWEGKKTIAYPWSGEAIEATGELLKSGMVKKIGFNIKFEDRWTIKEFGFPVANWTHDGMQVAHVYNNVKGVTSLNFQSFVLLGNEKYSQRVSKYLKEDNGAANRELDLRDLLLYNGMDALIEFETAKKQMEMM